MIVIEHGYNDPEKPTYLRHRDPTLPIRFTYILLGAMSHYQVPNCRPRAHTQKCGLALAVDPLLGKD